MDYGYRRIATATFDVKIGDCAANAESIINIINENAGEDIDLIVFPELCVTGYTCGDMFLRKYLTDEAAGALIDIAAAASDSGYKGMWGWGGHVLPVIVAGAPLRCEGKLFNCAVIIYNGEIVAAVPKTYLPNYNEYYEKRWFSPAPERTKDSIDICGRPVPFGTDIIVETSSGLKIGCEICEDLWAASPPSSALTQAGANVIVNPSASNDYIAKKTYRRQLVTVQSTRCGCAYAYVSAGSGESTSDLVFSGHHIIAECGSVKAEESSYFQDGPTLCSALIDIEKIENDQVRFNSKDPSAGKSIRYLRIDSLSRTAASYPLPKEVNSSPFVPKDTKRRGERCAEILGIQAAALATRLRKTGIQKCVIGISGGLDSTLALLVIREAFALLNLPVSNIIAVTMPGFGTSRRTKTSADSLMRLIGADARTIDITAACRQHMSDIGQSEELYDITYENIQARERTQILMDLANKEGATVIGTGDLSELALGWCTFNGDHMSMYGVNSSIPKTLVRFIIETYAEEKADPEMREVLLGICSTVISPELLPPDENGNISQSTEQAIGSYDLHDFFLYHYIRNCFSPEKINALARIAFPDVPKAQIDETLKTFVKRFVSSQFKRNCVPDGPKVGTVALSPRGDFRMPSDYQGV